MKLTPPQVARLLCRPRDWGWTHVRCGDFGEAVQDLHQRGRPWLVELAAVEAYAGRQFTRAQLTAAINPKAPPDASDPGTPHDVA